MSKQTQTKDKNSLTSKLFAKTIKLPIQQEKTKYKQVIYFWNGDRQLQEKTPTHMFTTMYEQNSFETVTRLV
ncbi:hypothetical protein [Psychrobacter fjordensis]|uniref:hypothetical protein n=1 Tax=Psychrobacter fjordensis TaxID=664424 RepID=UPI001918721E|nr:hypothetical protein [Psychrobacter fjordensis]